MGLSKRRRYLFRARLGDLKSIDDASVCRRPYIDNY
jgi:hypothetical protein